MAVGKHNKQKHNLKNTKFQRNKHLRTVKFSLSLKPLLFFFFFGSFLRWQLAKQKLLFFRSPPCVLNGNVQINYFHLCFVEFLAVLTVGHYFGSTDGHLTVMVISSTFKLCFDSFAYSLFLNFINSFAKLVTMEWAGYDTTKGCKERSTPRWWYCRIKIFMQTLLIKCHSEIGHLGHLDEDDPALVSHKNLQHQ